VCTLSSPGALSFCLQAEPTPIGTVLAEIPLIYLYPRVGGEDAREFFRTLSAATSRNDSHLVINELERYFQRDRISYFVTSAIGFKVDAGTNKFDADYPENYEQAGRGFRILSGVHPINVAEPVLWLSDRIAGDPESA
jgi:hypothetical protein